MHRTAKSFVLASLAVLGACGGALPTGSGEDAGASVPFARSKLLRSQRAIPRRYIVVLERGEPGAAAPDVDALAARGGARVLGRMHHALRGFVGTMDEEAARALAEAPGVAWVEEDAPVHLATAGAVATNSWALDRIDQRTMPLDGAYVPGGAGAGVHAYLLDTGLRTTHAELAGRADGVYDGVGDGRGTEDCNGHGTHVAGIVGGATLGVAPGVQLHGMRVLDCAGNGTVSGVIAAVDWLTAHHASPAVANLSLGGGPSLSLDAAISRSIGSGITYVVAAGNGGGDACAESPARLPEAITVGASDEGDAVAGFSNGGPCVDLFAPGVGIPSAWNLGDEATARLSGTSMASPFVAGAAALYLSLHPRAAPAEVSDALVGGATAGELSRLPPGSPDALLYTRAVGGLPDLGPAATGASLPGCASSSELLVNGGFEAAGAGWQGTPGLFDRSSGPPPRSGHGRAWLGGYGLAHADAIWQDVLLPSSACKAALSLSVAVTTAEPGAEPFDTLSVTVRDPLSGEVLATALAASNADASRGWVRAILDLSPWLGRAVRVELSAAEDGALPTSFAVDDVSVLVGR